MARPTLALVLAASALAGALQTPSALLAHVQAACTTSGPPVCIIDGNNLRGAEFFGSSQGSLRTLVEGWADEAQLPALLILDHGPEERAWHVSSHAVLTLSGEGRTADDVIVRDAWFLRHELGRNVFVVTNDQGLIGRVKRYRSPAGSVQVLHTRAFARLLGIEESSATDARAAWSTSWPNGRAGHLYGSRRPHACAVRLRGPGPRGPAVQPWSLSEPPPKRSGSQRSGSVDVTALGHPGEQQAEGNHGRPERRRARARGPAGGRCWRPDGGWAERCRRAACTVRHVGDAACSRCLEALSW